MQRFAQSERNDCQKIEAEHQRSTYIHLSETHFISENAILAVAPQKRKPVETCQLEILEFTSCTFDIVWIFVHSLECGARMPAVVDTLKRKLALGFSMPIGSDLIFGDRVDILLKLPSAMFIIETLPLAEVLHVTICCFSVRNDALDSAECVKFFLFMFLV